MSDWKRSAASRRDSRNARAPDDVGKRPAAKKDRKRWCRGKAGVEHAPVARKHDEVKGAMTIGERTIAHPNWWLLVCANCGKELDRYWPMRIAVVGGGHTKEQPRPAWVPAKEW